MERYIKQRYAIKFCVKQKEIATETFEKLKRAYGDEVSSKAQVFRWRKSFKEGRENVEDEHRSGRPSTVKSDENVERVRSLVAADRRLTVRFVANELNMNKNDVHQIFYRPFGHEKRLRENGAKKSCHGALSVRKFLASKQIPVLPQPP
jgi:hypothetical protein